MADVEKKFKKAAEDVKTLKKQPDNDTLLKLYALYKQAVSGDVAGDRPGAFNLVGRAKYDAWAGMKGTASAKAMQSYVDLVAKLLKVDKA
ncbi:MAG: acyl-CoA-binding protein [Acidobacteriota bacterium]